MFWLVEETGGVPGELSRHVRGPVQQLPRDVSKEGINCNAEHENQRYTTILFMDV